jgi:hypothetical protein
MAIKYTKWPKYIPNGHKIGKYQHFPVQGPPKCPLTRIFWFENMPSGNPGAHTFKKTRFIQAILFLNSHAFSVFEERTEVGSLVHFKFAACQLDGGLAVLSASSELSKLSSLNGLKNRR